MLMVVRILAVPPRALPPNFHGIWIRAATVTEKSFSVKINYPETSVSNHSHVCAALPAALTLRLVGN